MELTNKIILDIGAIAIIIAVAYYMWPGNCLEAWGVSVWALGILAFILALMYTFVWLVGQDN